MSGAGGDAAPGARRALPLQPAGGLQQVGALEAVWQRVDAGSGELEVAVWGETRGASDAVLAVHDTPGNALAWAGVAGLLDGAPPLVAPDLSRGPASAPRAPLPAERQAEGLVAVLDALGVERVTLAGHGAGGPVAAAVAATVPERVQRLVLVGEGGRPVGDELSGTFPSREDHRAAWQARIGLGAAWNRLAEGMVARDVVGEAPDLRSAGATGSARVPGASPWGATDWSRLAGVPVTLVRAEPAPGRDADSGAGPADARTVTVAGVGHWGLLLALKGADAVARAMLAPYR